MRRGVYTRYVSHAHFSDTFSLRGVQTSRTRMAQGVCSAHVISLHLTLSILMFHPPSSLFPHGHFDTSFPSAPSLPNCSRSESAGLANFRTSGEEFGYLTDRTHSTVLPVSTRTSPGRTSRPTLPLRLRKCRTSSWWCRPILWTQRCVVSRT